VAVLDVLDVDPGSQGRGCGRKLLEGVTQQLRHMGVSRVYSEAEWTNHGLLRFFDASGFKLAQRVILERRIAEPFTESADGV
jgi:N-acetylglutamate synthase-like GNAT family acetyltransferase